MTDNERAAMVAAKRYARQFRNGRSFDRITGYAQTDFLAGVAWAQQQKAEEPEHPHETRPCPVYNQPIRGRA